MTDVANQLANGLICNSAEHVQDGQFGGRQRQAESHTVQAEIELVDVDLVEDTVELARVLSDKKRLHIFQENREECAHASERRRCLRRHL